jgi:Mrp family chromosome partitioning ATPase
LFGLSKDVGISEYVLGMADKEQVVKQTGYKNVYLVTGGARIHNSSLVLTSGVFHELMTYLREQFDYVILDCAPILQISDYIHISKVSDGVLFVAAYSQTTKAQAVDAVKELKKNNIPILGSVFSMYDKRKEKGYDYKHYYYYSYSSSYYDHVDDEQKEEKDKK